jgi:hypothetical protein
MLSENKSCKYRYNGATMQWYNSATAQLYNGYKSDNIKTLEDLLPDNCADIRFKDVNKQLA